MVLRESTPWRWSHTRHHTDTIIVGRDPEIAVPRPPDIAGILLGFFSLKSGPKEFKRIVLHCFGRLTAEEATYVPDSERLRGLPDRAHLGFLIYLAVIAWAGAIHSVLPLMLVGLPSFYGAWLLVIFGLTQHAGLAEDVLDHRLNCRTVYMNPVFRFVYWNMNYPSGTSHVFRWCRTMRCRPCTRRSSRTRPGPTRDLLSVSRDSSGAAAAGEKPCLLRQARAAAVRETGSGRSAGGASGPSRQSTQPHLYGNGQRLDQGLPGGRHRAGGCDPLRSRRPHLCDLPDERRPVLRHRRPVHPREGASGRRPGDGPPHRMSQAQRAI